MRPITALEFGASAILLYELAHIAVAHALKVRVFHVGITWRGVYVRRERAMPLQNLAIALAGPSLTLALAVLFRNASPGFALCNLLVCIANLLPLPASDGLRIFLLTKNLSNRRFDPETGPAAVVDISQGRRPALATQPASGHVRAPLPFRVKPQYDRIRITSGPYKGRFIGAHVTGFTGPEISLSHSVYPLHDQPRAAARFFDRRASQLQTELKAMGINSELI
jgi:hypothetical protein